MQLTQLTGISVKFCFLTDLFLKYFCSFFRVTKTVDEDSLEASYMKKEETKKAEPNHSVTPAGCVG